MHNRILLIEDDPGVALPLKDFFEDHGLEVIPVLSGEAGIEAYHQQKPDLILLDIILPGKSGFDVIAEIRDTDVHTPFILMTGTELDDDSRIKGYTYGALNYMQKPIIPQAVLALTKNILSLPATLHTYQIGDKVLRIQGQSVDLNGEKIQIREKDGLLLEFLCRHKDQVVSRTVLLKYIWKDGHPDMNNLLDGAVLRIRRMLKENAFQLRIETVYGSGYILKDG